MPVAMVSGSVFQSGLLLNLMASQSNPSEYHRKRALKRADEGDKLIERIAFWDELPLVGRIIADRLADELEYVVDDIERELERAA